jgi:hypothetical protein
MTMTEISKLKKENKQLRALLRDAIDLLKQSKKLLKQPKNRAEGKKPKKEAKGKETKRKEAKKK